MSELSSFAFIQRRHVHVFILFLLMCKFCNWKPGIEDYNLSNIESLKVCFVYLHGVLLSCSVGVDINDSLLHFKGS